MKLQYSIVGGDFSNAGKASSEVKKVMKQIFADHDFIRRAMVALFEAEVNVVAHAYKGNINVDIQENEVLMIISDEGPGIGDINLAMQEGYSTASDKVREMGFGAGMGLANIKKNSDLFNIESTVGKGTKVTIKCLIIK